MKIAYLFAPVAFAVCAPALAQAMTAKDYVMEAGAGDLYEIQSSKLVLQTTKDPKVRSFATKMIVDHNKSTAKVKVAAMKSGLKPKPPMLKPAQAEMIAQLKAVTGTTRDATYVTQQKQAHAMALTLHQTYAQAGTAPALKMVATAVVPVVQHHIEMLNMM